MAVGDIITGVGAVNTQVTFTPAAGVEIMIICVSGQVSTRAVDSSGGVYTISNQTESQSANSRKMGITNSLPLWLGNTAGIKNWYSGIQIK